MHFLVRYHLKGFVSTSLNSYAQRNLEARDDIARAKGWVCEARSHLGSPLGELCSIVFGYETFGI